MVVNGLVRLCADPEVRYSQGQNPVAFAHLRVAAARKFKREGEPDADFFDCTAFGKQAEFCEKYLRKGVKIYINGDLRQDTYTNKDGQKVVKADIMIREIEFAESAGTTATTEPSTPTPAKAAASAAKPAAKGKKAANTTEGFIDIPDGLGDELPWA